MIYYSAAAGAIFVNSKFWMIWQYSGICYDYINTRTV